MGPHELNRMFDRLAPTPEQEQAGLDRLLNEEREEKPVKKIKALTILGLAAALMVVSCAAAGLTGLDRRLLEYFGAGREEQLSSAVVAAEPVSHTYPSGWTVQIGQVLADRYMATAVVDITAPEGVDLAALVEEEGEFELLADYRGEDRGGNLLFYRMYFSDGGPEIVEAGGKQPLDSFEKREVKGHGFDGSGHFQILDDTDLEQGHISALWTFRSNVVNMNFEQIDLLGARLRLSVKGLLFENKDEAAGDKTVKALFFRGEAQDWTYEVRLPETDPGRMYTIEKPIQSSVVTQELKTVYLSPIELAYDLYYHSDTWETYHDPNDAKGHILNLADGTAVSMKGGANRTGLVEEEDSGGIRSIHHASVTPARLVEPDEVVSVTILGQTFGLK